MRKAVKHYSRNSGYCFANFSIQLILFHYIVYCSVYCLAAFFILCAIGLSLFFSTFWQWVCLPSLCMFLLLSVSPFLNLCHNRYHSFLGIKNYNRVWFMRMTTKVWFCGNYHLLHLHQNANVSRNTLQTHFSQRIAIRQFDTLLTNINSW